MDLRWPCPTTYSATFQWLHTLLGSRSPRTCRKVSELRRRFLLFTQTAAEANAMPWHSAAGRSSQPQQPAPLRAAQLPLLTLPCPGPRAAPRALRLFLSDLQVGLSFLLASPGRVRVGFPVATYPTYLWNCSSQAPKCGPYDDVSDLPEILFLYKDWSLLLLWLSPS